MKKFLRDMVEQCWTVLGMGIAWIVLDGSAKMVVGWAIVATMTIWIITYPLRNFDD